MPGEDKIAQAEFFADSKAATSAACSMGFACVVRPAGSNAFRLLRPVRRGRILEMHQRRQGQRLDEFPLHPAVQPDWPASHPV
jgi:hypothetical protein